MILKSESYCGTVNFYWENVYYDFRKTHGILGDFE